jgi:hypothetical protein
MKDRIDTLRYEKLTTRHKILLFKYFERQGIYKDYARYLLMKHRIIKT